MADDDSERDAQVTVRLPTAMLEQIKEAARKEERSISQYLRLLITKEMERKAKERP